ncbi:hypothetical protein L596_011184 [Steinernema carpocapsae]|uniref:Uncharacterized protein n=1 Tax=Steinernema carpocapsae TaxID=34508 RepID=A0A4U5NU20_STECR|nr:hypothetical protein L596_011184 [Steinernema carpocapsae]
MTHRFSFDFLHLPFRRHLHWRALLILFDSRKTLKSCSELQKSLSWWDADLRLWRARITLPPPSTTTHHRPREVGAAGGNDASLLVLLFAWC